MKRDLFAPQDIAQPLGFHSVCVGVMTLFLDLEITSPAISIVHALEFALKQVTWLLSTRGQHGGMHGTSKRWKREKCGVGRWQW
eukprot:SAG31_NODE_31176_length_371_cov_0.757353_2_plen_83_part_01